MNNYPSFQNYNYTNMYNKMNNPFDTNFNNMYAMDMMNTDMFYNKDMNKDNTKKNNNLFDPYNALIRGNLFKDLYDPYKIKEPYDIRPMNEQAELLTNIEALGFSMTDLNLYLDIHSNDKKAIDLYNQYRVQKENLMKEYEAKYGPITLNSDSLNSTPWAWDDMPWPWDN